MAVPRVRPRVPMEDRVDTTVHPLPPMIATEFEPEVLSTAWDWTTKAAIVLLAVFLLALPLAGFLGVLEGSREGVGLLGLAISSLTASILLGAE